MKKLSWVGVGRGGGGGGGGAGGGGDYSLMYMSSQ